MRNPVYCLLIAAGLCTFTPGIVAQSPKESKSSLNAEMLQIENEAIPLIQKQFAANDLGLRTLIETYGETKKSESRMLAFSAIGLYVKLTLVPKLGTPTPAQKNALNNFDALVERHEALQNKYSEL